MHSNQGIFNNVIAEKGSIINSDKNNEYFDNHSENPSENLSDEKYHEYLNYINAFNQPKDGNNIFFNFKKDFNVLNNDNTINIKNINCKNHINYIEDTEFKRRKKLGNFFNNNNKEKNVRDDNNNKSSNDSENSFE